MTLAMFQPKWRHLSSLTSISSVRRWPATGHLDFVLRDELHHPFYAWPRTLLNYSLGSDIEIDPTQYRLTCLESGEVVPFQVSQPRQERNKFGRHDVLRFVSDLPSSASRTYRLASGDQHIAKSPVTVVRQDDLIVIDLGPLQVCIPASQDIKDAVPGPLIRIGRDGRWVGSSILTIARHPIVSIKTEQVEVGPLVVSFRITYLTLSGYRYIATVECVSGMDFIRLYEDMENLPTDVTGEFNFSWTGCKFTHRQAPNHPYNFPHRAGQATKYADYSWEAIGLNYMDTQFGVMQGISASGKLPFSLRLFEPWSDMSAASYANFWADDSEDAAGLFIDRVEDWSDQQYAIWHSSNRLGVDFVYSQSTLHFVWKIASGTRSTCVSYYAHAKDIEAMETLEKYSAGIRGLDGVLYKTSIFPNSYMLQLQNWYGTLNLDRVKDWILLSPIEDKSSRALFKKAPLINVDEFLQSIWTSQFVTQLPVSGVRQNEGFGPTSSRIVLEEWLPSYQILRDKLTDADRLRVDAIMLFLAYVHAGEDYMPMKRMLAGHPNFLADVKSVPPAMLMLFPEHRCSQAWSDEWEGYLSLSLLYHTRPPVEAWNARGGRWTENLGTYIWAFLRPSLRASFVLKCRDGYERFCAPQIEWLGDWLVNALSAPFGGESADTMKRIADASALDGGSRRHHWGIVRPTDGPRRVHPPIGAHSERRKTPRSMWYMGMALRNYSPLVAEHLMWASRPTDQDMEMTPDQVDPWAIMYAQPDNRGTNPHLRTSKYTGYGITLRAGMGGPRELSIHLLQIDDGPNYRWGNGTEGSCGLVYFYANEKAYSHNGMEDEGDRIDQDTDFGSNFGVWKEGRFRSIGQNVLSSPLYDLTFAQFAQITAREGKNSYSWPEYVSRNILLAGDDYFVLYDKVFNEEVAHRFSWFVRKGDAFPQILLLSDDRDRESRRFTSIETEATTGKWVEGVGGSVVLVTHKDGIRAESIPYGGRVFLEHGTDLFFTAPKHIEYWEEDTSFAGQFGIVRNRNEYWEVALFHGTHISAPGISLTTEDNNLGISAKVSKGGGILGHYFAPNESSVSIGLSEAIDMRLIHFYIDGAPTVFSSSTNGIRVKLPKGNHVWELCDGLPVPLSPTIANTVYRDGGARILGTIVPGASSYELEISEDNATSWKGWSVESTPSFELSKLTNGQKYHVRIIAKNSQNRSEPGLEYPVYITQEPPQPPDGVKVELNPGVAIVSWGEVLGVAEYRLHYKKKGESGFRTIYTGDARIWRDSNESVLHAASLPHDQKSEEEPECQYYVTCVNGNGESRPSRIADTHSMSWRNWSPVPGERFRRTVELITDDLPNDGVGQYYPL